MSMCSSISRTGNEAVTALKGVVAPNCIGWDSGLVPTLRYLGVQRLQVLIYEAATLDDQILDMLIVQSAIPGIEFTLRFYAQNILTFDAGVWARSRRRMLNKIMDAGVNVQAAILANEPNIELPPELSEDWGHQARWYVEAANAWYNEPGPLVDLDLPAGSPTPAFLSEGLDVYASYNLGQIYHRIDLHIYCKEHLDSIKRVHELFPHTPVSVSEWNLANWT